MNHRAEQQQTISKLQLEYVDLCQRVKGEVNKMEMAKLDFFDHYLDLPMENDPFEGAVVKYNTLVGMQHAFITWT